MFAAKVFKEIPKIMPAQATTTDQLDKMKKMEDELDELRLAKTLNPNATHPKRPRSIMESFNKAAGLPVREEICEEDDQADDQEPSPLAELERGTRPKVLAKNGPTSSKPKDVTTWISKLALSSAKKSKLKSMTDKMSEYYNKLPKLQQEGLGNIAAEWGLNCKIASTMSDANLLRVLATALLLSN